MAQKEMIRIRLKAYDHQVIDQSAEKIDDLMVIGLPPAHQEGSRHHPAGRPQVQGQPRAV